MPQHCVFMTERNQGVANHVSGTAVQLLNSLWSTTFFWKVSPLRGNVRKRLWEMCFYLTVRHYQGFFLFIQGTCILSWPLKVHLRAVLFDIRFLKMYIKLWSRWQREAAFSQSHEGCECQPVLTPLGSICKAKCPRHSVHFLKTNIFFSSTSSACHF